MRFQPNIITVLGCFLLRKIDMLIFLQSVDKAVSMEYNMKCKKS